MQRRQAANPRTIADRSSRVHRPQACGVWPGHWRQGSARASDRHSTPVEPTANSWTFRVQAGTGEGRGGGGREAWEGSGGRVRQRSEQEVGGTETAASNTRRRPSPRHVCLCVCDSDRELSTSRSHHTPRTYALDPAPRERATHAGSTTALQYTDRKHCQQTTYHAASQSLLAS